MESGSLISSARGSSSRLIAVVGVKLLDDAEDAIFGQRREDHAWAPANKAVEIIARLTGNLEGTERSTEVRITKVTVVLPSRKGLHDGELRAGLDIVDAEGITVLPSGDD